MEKVREQRDGERDLQGDLSSISSIRGSNFLTRGLVGGMDKARSFFGKDTTDEERFSGSAKGVELLRLKAEQLKEINALKAQGGSEKDV